MINDFQTFGAYDGFVELYHLGVAPEGVNATADEVMTFQRADGAKVFPYAVRTLVDSDGWIDVRGFDNLTILSWALTEDSNILVQSRQSSVDPTSPPATLVANATLTAGAAPTETHAAAIANITHIRILHSADSSTGGTTNVSIYLK